MSEVKDTRMPSTEKGLQEKSFGFSFAGCIGLPCGHCFDLMTSIAGMSLILTELVKSH